MSGHRSEAPGGGAAAPRGRAGKRESLIAAYREGLQLAGVLLIAGMDSLRLLVAGPDGETVRKLRRP